MVREQQEKSHQDVRKMVPNEEESHHKKELSVCLPGPWAQVGTHVHKGHSVLWT